MLFPGIKPVVILLFGDLYFDHFNSDGEQPILKVWSKMLWLRRQKRRPASKDEKKNVKPDVLKRIDA